MTRDILDLMDTWTTQSVPFVKQYADVAQNEDIQRYSVKYERALREISTLYAGLYLYKGALAHKSYTLGQLAACVSRHKNDAVHKAAKGRLRNLLAILEAYQLITNEEVKISSRSVKYKITATPRLVKYFSHYFKESEKAQ